MATPTQLSSAKLEENPLLPLDNQQNLVYTLTRIFRLLAQIVNPLVAWASETVTWIANWNGIKPEHSGTNNYSTGLSIEATGTPGNAVVELHRASGAAGQFAGIQGYTGENLRWQLQLGNGTQETGTGNAGNDAAFYRYNDAGVLLGTPLSIFRSSGQVTVEGDLMVRPSPAGGDPTRSLVSHTAGSSGNNYSNYYNAAGTLRWQTYANETDFCIVRFNDAVVGSNAFRIDRAGGTATFYGSVLFNGISDYYISRIAGSPPFRVHQYAGNWYWRWNEANGTLGWMTPSGEVLSFNQSGTLSVSGGIYSNYFQGVHVTSYTGQSGVYSYANLCLGNPAWNLEQVRAWHQHGSWAGFQLNADNANQIQIVLSNAGTWGSIRAASFDVQSDERGKERVAALPQQHDAYMGIEPISWEWPAPVRKKGGPPLYPDLRPKWGFSAQNLTKQVPLAVIGDVTAKDRTGQPVLASVDPVPIAALTVLEVQALWRRIAQLETRLIALEGA